jgi:hypothetical protein
VFAVISAIGIPAALYDADDLGRAAGCSPGGGPCPAPPDGAKSYWRPDCSDICRCCSLIRLMAQTMQRPARYMPLPQSGQFAAVNAAPSCPLARSGHHSCKPGCHPGTTALCPSALAYLAGAWARHIVNAPHCRLGVSGGQQAYAATTSMTSVLALNGACSADELGRRIAQRILP